MGSRIKRNGRKRGPAAALVIACGLLQLAASLQTQSGLSVLAWLVHPHSHALVTVIDGSHVDLVYSHDPVSHPDADDVQTHLHGEPSTDHLVHMTSDDSRVAHRIAPPDIVPTISTISFVPLLRAAPRPRPPAPVRAVPPFSRRSVVLRT